LSPANEPRSVVALQLAFKCSVTQQTANAIQICCT